MRFKIRQDQPSSFLASARYIAGHSHGHTPERVKWAYGRNLETGDPDQAARTMQATADQNPRCTNPVYHITLAFDPRDAAAGRLDDRAMREATDDTIERMGLGKHQALVYAHRDTDHPHVHILANRVHPETLRVHSRHNERQRLLQHCRDIARERGLNVARAPAREHDRSRPSEPDDRNPRRNQPTPKKREDTRATRDELRDVFREARSWDDLTARLNDRGYHLAPKGQGLIVSDGETYAKLSDMGKDVRKSLLEKRFGEGFDAYTARAAERAANARTPGAEAGTSNNAVRDLDKADRDVRQTQALAASYDDADRRMRDRRRRLDHLQSHEPLQAHRADQARDRLLKRLEHHFTDAASALSAWDRLEKDHGPSEADRFIKTDPRLLGTPRAHTTLTRNHAQARARRSLNTLIRRRDAWRHERDRLKNLRKDLKRTRADFARARQTYVQIRQVAGDRDVITNLLRSKLKARASALQRVSERMIRESRLGDQRKAALIRAYRIHQTRRRQARKAQARDRDRRERERDEQTRQRMHERRKRGGTRT